MMYLGIDYHKRFSFATKMDDKGNILEQIKISNDRTTLKNYLSPLSPDTKIALEATGNWYSFYELVEEKGLDISLAHPSKTINGFFLPRASLILWWFDTTYPLFWR